MQALVVAFPLAKRAGYLRRQSSYVRSISREAGERHIARQLDLQRQYLLSKGVASPAVESEVRTLAAILRAQLWQGRHAPGGAA